MALPDLHNKLIVLQGVSNSGKSTYSEYLASRGFIIHHPIDFYLRRLEYQYKLPAKILDTQIGKKLVMNEETGVTFLDYLIDWFHLTQKCDPDFTAKSLSCDLSTIHNNKYNTSGIVLQSIRSVNEIKAVHTFANEYLYNLQVVHIIREEQEHRSSDRNNEKILQYCRDANIKILNFSNNDSIKHGCKWMYSNLCLTP